MFDLQLSNFNKHMQIRFAAGCLSEISTEPDVIWIEQQTLERCVLWNVIWIEQQTLERCVLLAIRKKWRVPLRSFNDI